MLNFFVKQLWCFQPSSSCITICMRRHGEEQCKLHYLCMKKIQERQWEETELYWYSLHLSKRKLLLPEKVSCRRGVYYLEVKIGVVIFCLARIMPRCFLSLGDWLEETSINWLNLGEHPQCEKRPCKMKQERIGVKWQTWAVRSEMRYGKEKQLEF